MKINTTIHDIAKALNITASTVSRALNDHPRISKATKEAVREMAKRLNYQQNNVASSLRRGKTNIIGVMVPTANRSFFANVVRGIEQEAGQAGYNILIVQSNDSLEMEKSNIQALLQARVSGIIASLSKETQTFDHFRRVRESGIPLILFDRVYENLGASTVVVDDYLGAFQATSHLIQQGCRRIAHFAGLQHINIYRYRLRGYREALEHQGLPYLPELVIIGDQSIEEGRRNMADLLELPQAPDAVFAASDYRAIGAMQLLKERRLRIPEDVALVGFANEPFDSFVDPGLSSVDQHSEEMGQFAARIFLEEVAAKDPVLPRKIVLTPDLIIRESSMKKQKNRTDDDQ